LMLSDKYKNTNSRQSIIKSPAVYSAPSFQYHINDQSWLVVDRRALVRVKSVDLENLPLLELPSPGLSRVHLNRQQSTMSLATSHM
jgi:hypothetical protein